MPRKRRQKPSLAPVGREMGSAALMPLKGRGGAVEGYQRPADGQLLVVTRQAADEAPAGIVRALGDPLDFYLHRRMISDDEYTAGDTLRRDHFSAFGSGYQTVNLGGVHGGGGAADNWRFSPFQADRLRDFIAATDQLPKDTARLVDLVVIRGVFANEAARQIGRPQRDGFSMLKAGLERLATFYQRGHGRGKASNQGRPRQNPPA